MPRAKAEIIVTRKPRSANIKIKEVQEAIHDELIPVAVAHEKSRARIVTDWSNRPRFEATIKVSPRQITLSVRQTNWGSRIKNGSWTIGQLWDAIDKTGTPPHKIRPRRAGGKLAFPWGGPGSYQARTGAGPARFGGPGQVTGDEMAFFTGVNHPGFPPRHLTRSINTDLKDDFRKGCDRGMKKGLRRRRR